MSGSSRQHDTHRMISLEEPPLSLTGKTKAHASKTEVKASRTSFPAVPPEMTQTERWLADVLADDAMPILSSGVGLNRSSALTRRIRLRRTPAAAAAAAAGTCTWIRPIIRDDDTAPALRPCRVCVLPSPTIRRQHATMPIPDYYKILNVQPNANEAEIRQAYKVRRVDSAGRDNGCRDHARANAGPDTLVETVPRHRNNHSSTTLIDYTMLPRRSGSPRPRSSRR